MRMRLIYKDKLDKEKLSSGVTLLLSMPRTGYERQLNHSIACGGTVGNEHDDSTLAQRRANTLMRPCPSCIFPRLLGT